MNAKVLKIAITADPELPVPPELYGGIERIIDMLIRELVARGHEVTLFAHPDSRVSCSLVPYPRSSSLSSVDTLRNMLIISGYVQGGGFDVVHSFGRIAYLLPLLPFSIPKLMTYQRAVTVKSVVRGHKLSRGTLHFSAISQWMMQEAKHLANWHLVYNGVPMDIFDFVPTVGKHAPLVFLGRIEEIKGPHLAIEVAKRSGRSLIIAGNVPPESQAWFESEVVPHVNGRDIRYVGPVNDAEKNNLLRSAVAFLMPSLWEEPFGIVMAEAMACGTPVIGLARGAVPEVVEHGVTGFVEKDVDGLVVAVGRIDTIERSACRERAERFFSETTVVEGYLGIYHEMLAARERH